jgi:hypothetical protein
VRGVDEDGQVRERLHRGHHREVERVPREVRERAHAALAEHDRVVALGDDVLRRHQELLEGGGEPALQQHGLLGPAAALEQREVLHVARADLDRVGVALHEVDPLGIDGLRDHGQPRLVAGGGEDPEALLAEALERVGARARLEGAPAEQLRPRALDLARDRQHLLVRLHRAGPRHHHE